MKRALSADDCNRPFLRDNRLISLKRSGVKKVELEITVPNPAKAIQFISGI